MSQYQDIELVCLCGKPFTWTKGEQEFINDLLSKGKVQEVSQPKRCKDCRAKKKQHYDRPQRES